jgi:hypothetical protein
VIAQDLYRCTLLVTGEAFDCRLLVTSRILRPGETYELPVKFLSPHLVVPKLAVGTVVTLWEGKEIATGEVIELV